VSVSISTNADELDNRLTFITINGFVARVTDIVVGGIKPIRPNGVGLGTLLQTLQHLCRNY